MCKFAFIYVDDDLQNLNLFTDSCQTHTTSKKLKVFDRIKNFFIEYVMVVISVVGLVLKTLGFLGTRKNTSTKSLVDTKSIRLNRFNFLFVIFFCQNVIKSWSTRSTTYNEPKLNRIVYPDSFHFIIVVHKKHIKMLYKRTTLCVRYQNKIKLNPTEIKMKI